MPTFEPEGEYSDFFDESPHEWTQTKLNVLREYMPFWATKRGYGSRRLLYVDGFAGRGSFGTGDSLVDGSPVVVARLAQEIKQDPKRAYTLYCRNTELDAARCRNLMKNLAFADNDIVKTYCGPFEDHFAEIVAEMKGAPAVIFLDPCGIIGIAPDEIEPVLRRPDTEILLTLSLPTIQRMSGAIISLAPEARGKLRRLNRVLGEDPDEPNPEWAKAREQMDVDEWADWASSRYRSLLNRMSPDLQFGMTYPVRAKKDSATKYYLVFASRSLEPFPMISHSLCKVEDELSIKAENSRVPSGQLGLGMLDPIHISRRQAKVPEVTEEIYEFGLTNQGCTSDRIFQQFCYRYLGDFNAAHIRKMIAVLVAQGKASIYDGPDKHSSKDRRPITFH
jgi:three-Cys-motif partner protein